MRRSTVHRVLQARGLSARKARVPDTKDLDRFEAEFPNDLWQSDMLVGPWLPDPQQPGKMRRAHLYAFMDDHSRLLLHGRFSFKGDLPALELVMRRSFQKYGVCRRVYYDNGQVYRSLHMKQIVATLGIHRIIFTKPYRPMGHGKIEALNRLIRSAFLAEIKASQISTLDALNEAFVAWADYEYNEAVHSEIGQPPLERWKAGLERVRYVDDEQLRQAFLWKEHRTPDKTGVFSMFGVRYQVGPQLAKKRIEIRFDPEQLHQIEIWYDKSFVERVRPLEILPHRRPRPADPEPACQGDQGASTGADWLGHLVEKRRREGFVEPPPRQLVEDAQAKRAAADRQILDLLTDRLDPAVVDEQVIYAWLDRYGPLQPDDAARMLDRLLVQGEPADQHVTFYLDAIRNAMQGGER